MTSALESPTSAPFDPKVEGQTLNALDAQLRSTDSQVANQASIDLFNEYSKIVATLPANEQYTATLDPATWGAFDLTAQTAADLGNESAYGKALQAIAADSLVNPPTAPTDASPVGAASTASDQAPPQPANRSDNRNVGYPGDNSTNISNGPQVSDTSSPSGFVTDGPGGITTSTGIGGGSYVSDGPGGITTSTAIAGGGFVSDGPDGITTSTPIAGGGFVSDGPDGITTSIPIAGGGFVSDGPSGTSFSSPTGGESYQDGGSL